jgi:hypothetical protein
MTQPITRFDNTIINGSAAEPQVDVYSTSTNQEYDLGTRIVLPDGRAFRYAQAGAALTTGALIQQAILGGATTTAQEDLAIATSGEIGQNFGYATILTTAQVADAFRDGYYCIATGSQAQGRGAMYRIDSHGPLAVESSKIPFRDEALRTDTLAGTSTVRLIANPYKNVIQAPVTTVSGAALGVVVASVGSAEFFWLQTWGPVTALCAGSMTIGTQVVRAVAVAGAIGPDDGAVIVEAVGYALATIDDTDDGPIMLMIAP